MEGRGTSRRRNPFKIWKRRISAVMALVLTVSLVLNTPISFGDLGFHISNVYASGSNAEKNESIWATASNARYEKGETQDVDIYIAAEDNEAAPGNMTSLSLYLKNNTEEIITEGVLTFKGSHIEKENGFFYDLQADTAENPDIIAGGIGESGSISGEGMLYQESLPEEEIVETADEEENAVEILSPDAEAEMDEEETADEEENHQLTELELLPGQLYEVRFDFYTDENETSEKANVKFSFRGETEEKKISCETKFYYSIGLPVVNISLQDGTQIESGIRNEMDIWMTEPTWIDDDLEERIKEQEEKEAEEEEEASSSEAEKASSSTAQKASSSDAGREEDKEKVEKYSNEAMEINESKVSYKVQIYGIDGVDFAPKKAQEAEDIGWISCSYEVPEDTKPGVYYGKVTATGKWNRRSFTSEQGFFLEVTGKAYPAQTFTAETDDIQVTVAAEEGILPKNAKLKVTKLTPDNAATEQQYKEAENALAAEGTQYDGMVALDIAFQNEEGNEIEPNGNVQVSIEMKETEMTEGVSPETVEVHHLKENHEGEEARLLVEKVADGAEGTAGTVERKETEDEAAVVAVEFEVESFSTFLVTYSNGSARADDYVETVDSDAHGISLKLFNYNERINGGDKADDADDSRALTFKNDEEGLDGTFKKTNNGRPYEWTVDDKRGEGSFVQGIVKSNLGADGYPETDVRGLSLGYLFDRSKAWNNSISEYSTNFLFTYDEDSGYYEYDSSLHAADYDEEKERFYVRDYTESAEDKDGGSFLPFNSADATNPHGKWNNQGTKFEYTQRYVDYWFGMTMETNFLQPQGGKINNGNDNMVFEFSGDDDVWVFIDDVLVLDLGGVHARVSGSIDFATGEVSVDGVEDTTIKRMFQKAGKSDAEINSIFGGGNTFKDYTTHHMKYYYLERGGDVANCHIKFNLQTIPEEDIVVGKRVEQNGIKNDVINDDTLYTFILTKGEQPVSARKYTVYSLDAWSQGDLTGGVEETTGADGSFSIEKDQVAVFKDIITEDSPEFTVLEDLRNKSYASEIDKVEVDGSVVDKTDAKASLNRNDPVAIYENTIRESTVDLAVDKVWKDNDDQDQVRPESVIMQVQYKDGNEWKPYPNDQEPLELTLDGTIDGDGESVEWKGSFRDLPAYRTTAEGSIVAAEYTVREIIIGENGIHIAIEDGGILDGKYIVTYSSSSGVDKNITTVHVTNTLAPDLAIKKVDADTEAPIPQGVTFSLHKIDGGTESLIGTAIVNGGTATFEYLLPGPYRLRETAAAPGYNLPTYTWLVVVGTDGSITVTNEATNENLNPDKGLSFTIENEPGAELPETGGPGFIMMERFGWMLLLMAMLGVEVQMLSNRKKRR